MKFDAGKAPDLQKSRGQGFSWPLAFGERLLSYRTDLGASRVFSSMIVLMQFGRLYSSLKIRIRKSLTV